MKTSNRITRLLNDLAGYWTEPVLEILNAAGKAHASVQNEIETWHTLNGALQSKLQAQGAFGLASSLGTVKEQVFASAISELARKYNLPKEHIRPLSLGRHLTGAEHDLLGELAREAPPAAFKSSRQTDFMPRLHFAAAAG